MYIDKSYIIDNYIDKIDSITDEVSEPLVTDTQVDNYINSLNKEQEPKSETFFSCLDEENNTIKIVPIVDSVATPDIIFDKDPVYNSYDINYYDEIKETNVIKNNYGILFPIIILGSILFNKY